MDFSRIKNKLVGHFSRGSEELEEIIKRETERCVPLARDSISRFGESISNRISGAVSHFTIDDDNIQLAQSRIENQGLKFHHIRTRRKGHDRFVLCGETLTTWLQVGAVPEAVEDAFNAAYPGLSETTSFLEHAKSLDEGQLVGFLSGVKGKLFEIQYVEYLNNDQLEEGYTASLAESVNQAGWDIKITGPEDDVVSLLQAKATDSVSYVQAALEKYPEIDVVTTEEVFDQLVLSSAASGSILDSAISNHDLESVLSDSYDSAVYDFSASLPVITLAFIAFTSYRREDLSSYEKAMTFSERTGTAYISTLLASSVGAVTQTWWLGLLAAYASHKFADEGLQKLEVLKSLQKQEQVNYKLLKKLGQ